MGDGGGVFIPVVIRAVLYNIGIFRLGKTLEGRGIFVFFWFAAFHFSEKVVECPVRVLFFNLLPLLFSGANLAVRRIANEDTGDRSQVFICVICVVHRTPESSVPRRRHLRDMFLNFI